MTIYLNHISSSSSSPLSLPDDALYCEEEDEGLWDDDEIPRDTETNELNQTSSSSSPPTSTVETSSSSSSSLLTLPEQSNRLCEDELDEELLFLFSKEKQEQQIHNYLHEGFTSSSSSSLSLARSEAVEWMLTVNSYYGFSSLTAILSITYLDRFLSSTTHTELFPKNYIDHDSKPWLLQLLAVTCVSLAAKVEEIHVPLLLDLQVVVEEGTKYIFETKTIQKMELLVLSTLHWKMNAVTPISFLDHLILKLRLSSSSHHLRRRCERLLLSLLPDSRFVRYLPSVLASATIMHVLDQVITPSEEEEEVYFKHQILEGLLDINKDDVKDCYELIIQVSSSRIWFNYGTGLLMDSDIHSNPHKRQKHCHGIESPPSPIGVIDACFGSDSSNDSWKL